MKKLIFIFFMLIGWVSGSGQDRSIDNASRNNEPVDITDLSGIGSTCGAELSAVCGQVKALAETNNNQLKLLLVKVYPPSVYFDKNAGVNAMVELVKKNTKAQYTNYILFIASVNSDQYVSLELDYAISSFPGNCNKTKDILLESLKVGFAKKSVHLSQVECEASNSLKYLKQRLSEGCNYNPDEVAKYLKSNGYNLIPLSSYNVTYGAAPRRIDKQGNGARDCGQVLDYTKGEMKLDNQEVSAILEADFLQGLSKRVVISSYKTFQNQEENPDFTLQSVVFAEILDPFTLNCPVILHFHFFGKMSDGVDYVGIGVKLQGSNGVFGNYTFDQIKDLVKANQLEHQSQFSTISWRVKGLAQSSIPMIEALLPQMIGKDAIVSSIEFYSGLMAGVFDGLIETIDVVSVVTQFIWHQQSQLNATNSAGNFGYLIDCAYHIIKMKGIMEGLQDKWDSDYLFKIEVNQLIDNISSLDINTIVVYFWNMIKDAAKDLMFLNGSFEAGYIRGKLVFEVIVAVLTGGIGEVKNIITMLKNANTLMKNIVQGTAEIASAKKSQIAALIGRNIEDLFKYLKDFNKLKDWYLDDMPAMTKAKLMDYVDKGIHSNYFSKLNGDLAQMPDLKAWLTTKGPNGLDSWRYMEDAFPDKIWCVH